MLNNNEPYNNDYNVNMNPEMTEVRNDPAYATDAFAPAAESAREVAAAAPRKRRFAKVALLALSCSLLGGAVGAGGMAYYNSRYGNNSSYEASVSGTESEIRMGTGSNSTVKMTKVETGKEMSAADIYEANVNATVGITTSATTNYFGYKTTSAASGSGFIITADGYIVTNYHVVEGANEIKVTTYDNTTYTAKLVGYDESNDIAVLKVDATGLQTVVLGDSDKLRVGDSVVAIGNPLGELTFSLTHGDVSALNRKVTINNNAMTLIQTDCAINSGNSGGALFNAYGEVIGITNAKYSSSGLSGTASIDNVGFAIPINSVVDIIRSIIEDGYIEKTYIGASIYDLDSQYEAFGIVGVAIAGVEEGSPADKAGLQENDVITKVNGKAISDTDELIGIIRSGAEGDVVTLTIFRKGETFDVKVTLGVRRQSLRPDQEEADTEKGQKQQNRPGKQDKQDQQEGQDQQDQQDRQEGQDQQGQPGPFPFGDGDFPFGDGTFPFGDGEFPFTGEFFGY